MDGVLIAFAETDTKCFSEPFGKARAIGAAVDQRPYGELAPIAAVEKNLNRRMKGRTVA